jgi:hypothetical protein
VNLGTTKIACGKQGVLTISPFQTTVNEGTLDFGGQLDMRTSPMVLTTAASFTGDNLQPTTSSANRSAVPQLIFADAGHPQQA